MDKISTILRESQATHEVFNQAPPLADYNPFLSDPVLTDWLGRSRAEWARETVSGFAQIMGSREVIESGFQANRHTPVLKTYDPTGNRIDEVEFHPSWHHLMRLAVEHGLHSLPWSEPQAGAHAARAAMLFVSGQIESGHGCPVSMTYSIIPALRTQTDLSAVWEPKLLSRRYDPKFAPAGSKSGVLAGMAMTEKQGGSDVRANTTQAVPFDKAGPGHEYVLTGHKWFCSAPMCDVFLILAQARQGLSCFLVPRWLPDQSRNRIRIQRLKDKLGNRSNASAEVEFDNCLCWLVGEEGRGIATIIEMVNHTRLDCALSSAALCRRALVQALHHCGHRSAFGKRLIDQPLMQNVLADLALESEAATALAMRIASSYDLAAASPEEGKFSRLATAIGKYWLAKRTPAFVAEALECLGGNGYVEESVMPRLFRESPLNSIWEGSGNVICLDVLRAAERDPETLEVAVAEIESASGTHPDFDQYLLSLKNDLRLMRGNEFSLRRMVERLALALQGSLLIQHSPDFIAEAFCRSRLGGEHGTVFGTLPEGVAVKEILQRAYTAS